MEKYSIHVNTWMAKYKTNIANAFANKGIAIL